MFAQDAPIVAKVRLAGLLLPGMQMRRRNDLNGIVLRRMARDDLPFVYRMIHSFVAR
jgi:hypothetical protein